MSDLENKGILRNIQETLTSRINRMFSWPARFAFLCMHDIQLIVFIDLLTTNVPHNSFLNVGVCHFPPALAMISLYFPESCMITSHGHNFFKTDDL